MMGAIVLSAASALLLAPSSVESAHADRRCTYSTGRQSPHVRHLRAHGLTCKSARKTISAGRREGDWRGAYRGDTWATCPTRQADTTPTATSASESSAATTTSSAWSPSTYSPSAR